MKDRKLILLFFTVLCLLLCACTKEPSAPTTLPLSSQCSRHTDYDDDGICDRCSITVLVPLDFFAVNDLHGKLADTDSQPGVDELSTYFKTAGTNTVILSSGDMWQGSSESNLTQGAIMTDWMNELGFVSMTLGNHEFDWGTDTIRENAVLAQFPFLAINVYDRSTDTISDFCIPSVMIERGGIKIGIIGAIGDCYGSIASDKCSDVYFKTGSDLTKLVKAEAASLRSQGAQLVVYSIHDGYEQNLNSTGSLSSGQLKSFYDSSLSDGSVDLVFEAHIHKHYVYTDTYGVYHLQGGGENAGISHVSLQLNSANGNVHVQKAEFVSSSTYDDYASDTVVNDLIDKYADQIALGDKILGYNEHTRNKDELRQLVAQLYFEYGSARWGDTYPIVLGGGYISVRNPWSLAPGDVKYADLQSLFPFDNQLVLCSILGRDLRSHFFETDNSNYFIAYGDYGRTVKENLDPNATYYIITDTYSSGYAPNHLTVVEEYPANVFARDLLADFTAQGGLGKKLTLSNLELTPIADILDLALAPGETTAQAYCVKGCIYSIENPTYGTLTIEDRYGNQLYVYGTYDETGRVRFGSLPQKPQLEQEVILYGQIQNYKSPQGNTVLELINARLLKIG